MQQDEVIDVSVLCFCMGASMAFGALFAMAAFEGLKRILGGRNERSR